MKDRGEWMSAIAGDDKEELGVLIGSGLSFEEQDAFGDSPIHWAATMGSEECLKLLIASGDNPMRLNSRGDCPLALAVVRRREGCARILAAHGGDFFASGGQTTLMIAAGMGMHGLIKDLSAKASIDLSDKFGKTALHFAAQAGHAQASSALIECGANPDARDCKDNTPLMLACSATSSPECVEALASISNMESVNDAGLRAIDVAESQRVPFAVKALLERVPSQEDASNIFWRAVLAFRGEEMAVAVAPWLDKASRNALEQTPFMMAARLGWAQAALAVAEQSDRLATDSAGNNALMLLCDRPSWSAVSEELFVAAATPQACMARNHEGLRAEDIALSHSHLTLSLRLSALRENEELTSSVAQCDFKKGPSIRL